MPNLLDHFAYLTPDLPGVGGVIKQRPQDFYVEEQLKSELSGKGEHVYLYIEKTGMTTAEAGKVIAKAFQIGKREVGWAGLKDKHAVTRQLISVRVPKPIDEAQALEKLSRHRRMNVLWVSRHDCKLRRGYHGGNKFVLYVREVDEDALTKAQPILECMQQQGVPNFLGEQRFGFRQNGHLLGKFLLLKDYQGFVEELLGHATDNDVPALIKGRAFYQQGDYAKALTAWPVPLKFDRQALDGLRQNKPMDQLVMDMDRSQLNFQISALQSHIFNLVLDQRLRDGTLGTLLAGDQAALRGSRSVFAVDQATADLENSDQGRMPKLDISPTGPLWGENMPMPTGDVFQLEQTALSHMQLTPEQMVSPNKHLHVDGSRRPLRAVLEDLSMDAGEDEHGPYLRVSFLLPRGAYATVALREIMKAR